MKQPIAMRCTKKQFKAIKPKLEEAGKIGMLLGAFEEYKYLTNNYSKEKNNFDFVGKGSLWSDVHKNNIHEEWNEKIFLEACGIEVEKTYSITESQIKKAHNAGFIHIEKWFPEAFESEVKLEVGKWYKSWNGVLKFWVTNDSCYGFNSEGVWSDIKNGDFNLNGTIKIYKWKEATEQEVFEALKNESVKRGFGDKIFIKRDFGKYFRKQVEINSYESPYDEFRYFMHYGSFENYGVTIFKNGKWAEIIPTITKEEAEKVLNKKIV